MSPHPSELGLHPVTELALISPEIVPRFSDAIDNVARNGHGFIKGLTSLSQTMCLARHIEERLGTDFRAWVAEGNLSEKLPLVAQLHAEYGLLLALNSARYPVLKTPLDTLDVYNYSLTESMEFHEDPKNYGPVVISHTLKGATRVRIKTPGRIVSYDVEPGDAFLLRGAGLGRGLEHEIGNPKGPDKRIAILTNGRYRA